ncbi:hypothetical protein SMD44_07346 [Streptomyces alboflavus]|uniref:Uncharacterized protein n=1 Tax=Streptomyces alboflavus TaxID=67267 RepID=A0A1Z1WN33_9ACTN|nr:hypothetical protein SMD44_07346 [Streptomyces alboflavus]
MYFPCDVHVHVVLRHAKLASSYVTVSKFEDD